MIKSDARALRETLSQKRQALARASLGARRLVPGQLAPITPRQGSGHAPLSFAQERLWFLDRLNPGTSAYNSPMTFRMHGVLNLPALQSSLEALVERHEVLRSYFPFVDGQPVQIIRAAMSLTLPVADLSGLPENERLPEALRQGMATISLPFDLDTGPVIRPSVMRLGPEDHILVVVLHHIVTDAWSRAVFMRELVALYNAFCHGLPNLLPPLPIQYSDFAVWQRNSLNEAALERRLAYWRLTLLGAPALLDLPADRPRPAVQSHQGMRLGCTLPSELGERLDDIGKACQATTFMTFLAAFLVLLYRTSGQEDIVVGTPLANRTRPEVEGLIGFFLNTLSLRTDLSGDPSFVELLGRVREAALGAYANHDLPFEKLVEELQPERSPGRTPIFQVMFGYQSHEGTQQELSGLKIELVDMERTVAKHDLSMSIVRTPHCLDVCLDFSTDLFDNARMQRLLEHFRTLLDGITADPNQRISRLPILTDSERQQLLIEWNTTSVDYPREQSFHELFEEQAELTPDAVAVACEDGTLTYRQLNARANQLAHYLRALGVAPEVFVGLALDRSLEMVVAILGTLKAGGAYVPLDTSYPLERLAFILDDAQPSVLLSRSSCVDSLPSYPLPVLCLDTDWPMVSTQGEANISAETSSDNAAYIIYTSGTTGRPKGAVIRQGGLTNYLSWCTRAYNVADGCGSPVHSSLSFDLTVTSLMPALLVGRTVWLVPESDGVEGLTRTLHSTHDLSLVKITPAHLELLSHELKREEAPGRTRAFIVGGEALLPDQAVFWSRWAPETRIVNEYGPTETVVGCCVFECGPDLSEYAPMGVPIGRPIANTRLYVLDSGMSPVPLGVYGELHIGGDGLARGYLNRAELTAEKFVPDPFSAEPGARLYRTGDLCRYLSDGNLEFRGRLDQQVKVRGYRIELGEIESVLLEHRLVREAVALVREDVPGDKRLVAYIVGRDGAVDTPDLRKHLLDRLPEYMVPSAYVNLESLSLTPNGKVDRKALPAPERESTGAEAFVEMRTPLEEGIAEIWREVLRIEHVGVRDDFFELGGHSLLATQVISRIHKTFAVELPLRALFEAPTIAGLAERIGAFGSDEGLGVPPLVRVSREGPLPLSFAQQRLWFINQLEPESSAYNGLSALRLTGSLDMAALTHSLQEIVERHEALRTTFAVVEGEPFQVIHEAVGVGLPVVDLSSAVGAEREREARRLIQEEAQRPFDLQQGPLFRFTLLRLQDEEHVLMLTLHHVVSDGWSQGVLTHELTALYHAFSSGIESPLPPLPIQYADYAAWQREWLQGEALQRQISYWEERLEGAPDLLELPTDRPRPPIETFRGGRMRREFSVELTAALKALSQREGATLFMTLLAAFQTLLYQYSGQEEIVVGTPIANRTHAELEGLIGFFVNTLVLRGDLSGEPSFVELLKRVREVCLGAYAHQDLPFEKLVEELQPERSLSHSPLFQVMFILQNAPRGAIGLEGLSIEGIHGEGVTSKFDLSLFLWETRGGLVASFEYNTDLFDADRIERLLGHYKTLLEGIVADPEQKVSCLPLLTEPELQQLLVEWNDTAADYPQDHCIHDLFEEQVLRTPDARAVVFGDQQLTYTELNRRANQLAYYLRKRGVGPEVLVGLCVERSLEMVVGILGILKAGGAYVPLDPSYPSERLAFMLTDAQAPILVSLRSLDSSLPPIGAAVVFLDEIGPLVDGESDHNPASEGASDHLAYVIYTSGSTGTPKGAMITHRGLVNYLYWCTREYCVEEGCGAPVYSSIGFDLTVTGLFSPLLAGRAIMLAAPQSGPEALGELLLSGGDYSLVKITPAHLELLSHSIPGANTSGCTRAFIIGGEALRGESLSHWGEHSPMTRIVNEYGPTETVVGCCVYSTLAGDCPPGPVPIGRPIANTQLYLLDRRLAPVPVGVPGELYIGGDGLGRGYLNRPELTAERFVPDPFSKEPGARLYRTGDLCRYLSDGNIEYLGRLDYQVKIRGFRIELGEIECVLLTHPSVRDAVVLAREDVPGDKRLTAYVVADREALKNIEELKDSEAEQTSQWQAVFDLSFGEANPEEDELFNIQGWNSSFTDLPIPSHEMREWVDQTVTSILALQPSRVVEIGCGTGLLLFQVAPHCDAYIATDFSIEALRYVERALAHTQIPPSRVKLQQKMADEFADFGSEAPDTVVVNSVVQYFPSIDYLVQVLEKAVAALAKGGSIFLGDLRSLTLLEEFQAEVELHHASDDTDRQRMWQRVQQAVAEEDELLIDPAFFFALRERLPQIARVDVQLKRGRYWNEMSQFRYDVVLHVGPEQIQPAEVLWQDWEAEGMSLASLERLLERKPDIVALAAVPNARVSAAVQAREMIGAAQGPQTAAAIRAAAETLHRPAVDPEVIWELGAAHGYSVHLCPSGPQQRGCVDVVLRSASSSEAAYVAFPGHPIKSLSSYANDPVRGKLVAMFVPQLRRYVLERLPEYMAPSSIMLLDALPLTPNGKVDRKALPSPDLARPDVTQDYEAPQTEVERDLAAVWAEVLRLERVGRRHNFFELGGHSLLATQVIARIRKTFEAELPLRAMFESPTVAELAVLIAEATGKSVLNVPPLVPVSREGRLPLSFAQQRLWFIDQLEPDSAVYNVPSALRLTGSLDIAALEQSLQEIVERHEALRTCFVVVEGEPSQLIHEAIAVTLPVVDLSQLTAKEREAEASRRIAEEAQRPFDLSVGPLFRAGLLRLGDEEHILLLTLHHIVSDEWSQGVLARELTALYGAFSSGAASLLPLITIQYVDFAAWQCDWLQGEALDLQIGYWIEHLEGAPPLLELPCDRPRPPIQTFRGARVRRGFSGQLTAGLKALGQREGATLFMTLLAAFQVLLSRYSGQDDIVVGTPIANRTQSETEGLIGFFVNTLVLRGDLSGDPSFVELLRRVREVALGAYAHQDLPFEKLVEALQPQRSLSHPALFQVMFIFQNAPHGGIGLEGLAIERMSAQSVTAKFDLSMILSENNGKLSGVIEYNTDLFDADRIERMLAHLEILLDGTVLNPHEKISRLPLLTEPERKQLLVAWNDTDSVYPSARCLHELFEEQVRRAPDAVALVFDGNELTYSQLNARANQLARFLRQEGVLPNALVGVCMARSVDMVVALLAILKAGGAYVAVDPAYPVDRIRYTLQDASASLILTQEALLARLPVTDVRTVCPDRDAGLISGQASDDLPCSAYPTDLAYVLYTSGSTGKPKGVAIEHHSPVALVSWALGQLTEQELSGVVFATSICFDLSVYELFVTLCGGGRVLLVENALAIAQMPAVLAPTLINTVPSAMAELLRQGGAPASLLRVNLAGEPLTASLVDAIYDQTTVHKVYDLYGPSEDTTYSTCALRQRAGRVTIGRPISNTQIYVLDGSFRPVPLGVAGELYIGGRGLSRGYLNRAELTAERFVPDPFSVESGARLYRTGDLCRYLSDGNIDFLGRLDYQVKIRGFRIELGEIESVLLSQPSVRDAVVLALEDVPGDKRLVGYVVGSTGSVSVSELREHLLDKLPGYMVPSAFVVLDALPLTPNGKVDRKALPAPEASGFEEDTYVAPRSPVEEGIAEIWGEVLRLDRVGRRHDFFELGGHSLLATQVMSRIRNTFQVELPLRVLFESPNVAGLADRVEAAFGEENTAAPPLVLVRREGRLPLSFAQQRLWFIDQLEPDSSVYNMPMALRLSGVLGVDVLQQSLEAIVERHEALRTTFAFGDGEPYQVIHEGVVVVLPVVDLSQLAAKEREAEASHRIAVEAQHPFDLSVGPLLRAGLLRLGDEEHILLLTLHHIVSDGWSHGVLRRELSTLYNAFCEGLPSPLTKLPIQYADYAAWQRTWLQGEALESQIGYWKQTLDGAPTLLELPTDRPRPSVQTFRGALKRVQLPESLSLSLKQLGQREGATLFMTLLAAFQLLLSRYSGQDDIVVGTPIANRTQSETEGLIGFFVNTLVLRGDLSGDPSFVELLRRAREVALGAYAHQDLPFEKLVEELAPDRSLSHSPILQVVLALQNMRHDTFDLEGLQVRGAGGEGVTAKFDLALLCFEGNGTLYGSLEYNTDLFDADRIERLLGHYGTLLEGIVANPEQHISRLPMLTRAEQEQILLEWNDTRAGYSRDKCIHMLFEEQVTRNPDAVAVIYEDRRLTYADLNRQANRLANLLRKQGVGPEALVGVFMDRSPEMIVALLGILKAGGAYVPIDPGYPEERISFILEDSHTTVLLTLDRLRDRLKGQSARILCLDTEAAIEAENAENLSDSVNSDNLAYVIYTSGSTGRPKGVEVCHQSLLNLVNWHVRTYELGPSDRSTHVARTSFDASVWEVWPPLAAGATLCIAGEDTTLSPQELIVWLKRSEATVAFLPTPLAEAVLADPACESLRLRALLTGGDRLHRVSNQNLPFRLINHYGPTESTVVATAGTVEMSEGAEAPPIGRPIDNTNVYILDAQMSPVPIGVSGELYIGGAGLSRGYLNQPALTAERFVADPFSAEVGARLYRTGDLCRYLGDGNIEYLGRIDHQVKVRGFRIELGEIESVLLSHASVRDAVVLAREDVPGDKRLTAYVVADREALKNIEELKNSEAEQTSQWQAVFDLSFGEANPEEDELFNIQGWNSSFTDLPIPSHEMREWVDQTVTSILALQPSRVVEIGCGTGLLLFQVAPHCDAYIATDFSIEALRYVERALAHTQIPPSRVKLQQKMADEFADFGSEAPDTVVVNSVVQYFPSIDYLVQVLEKAVAALAKGGSIFLGDLRSLTLLEEFQAEVELHHASDDTDRQRMWQRVQQAVAEEDELLIDPAFFFALRERLPQIARVDVQLKRGRYWNEMSQFRYDVVLHVGPEQIQPAEVLWQDWEAEGMSLASLERLLERKPDIVALAAVPNARVSAAVQAREMIGAAQGPQTAAAIRAAAETLHRPAVDPEVIWELGAAHGYSVHLCPSGPQQRGCVDVVLRSASSSEAAYVAFPGHPIKSLSSYANDPVRGKLVAMFVPQLRRYVLERLPEYMAPSSIMLLDALPLTPNGKVDRKALPSPDLARPDVTQDYEAPQTEVERDLAAVWAEVLRLERVGRRHNFFELGGHSLLATQVIARIRKTFEAELPLRAMFESPTVAELAVLIAEATGKSVLNVPPLVPVSREGRLPLSFAQQRLWFIDQLEPDSAVYNVPSALRLTGSLDIAALEQSLQEIVERHEALRTCFVVVEGEPSQLIHEAIAVTLPVVDLSQLTAKEREAEASRRIAEEAQRPFDLSVGPLFRAGLLRLGDEEHILLLTLHHIVSDGWSHGVLRRELSTLYNAFCEGLPSPLTKLPIQYADYAAWQRTWLQGEALESQIGYWKEHLAEAPTLLELPTDRPRPSVQTFRGALKRLQLPESLSLSLNQLGQHEGATLFMTLLAAFQVLLSRYSGQDDIVVGTPIANRTQSETEGLIGFFVNTLALRTDLTGDPSFVELLSRVRAIALGAYAHQDLPFEKLVEELQPERSLSHSPLFQVMFILQNAPRGELGLEGLQVRGAGGEGVTAKFDLTLLCFEGNGTLYGSLEYNTDLFDSDRIERMLGHWQVLLEGIVADPEQKVSCLPLLTEPELQQLLVEWNTVPADNVGHPCVHQLFESQVARTPEAIAVTFAGASLTYEELNIRANRLAHYLRQRGAGPDVLVCLYIERSLEMVVGMLGILKAGSAYVPLDPAYPSERLSQMILDARAPLLLTQPALKADLPAHSSEIVCLDEDWERIALQSSDNPTSGVGYDNLVYVIYTSGSTGKPKGTAVYHSGFSNLVDWFIKEFAFTATDRTLLLTSLSFDLTQKNVFGILCVGGQLHLAPTGVYDPNVVASAIATTAVTHLNCTPSHFYPLLAEVNETSYARLTSLRYVYLGGEAIDLAYLRNWLGHACCHAQLVNSYGPTECSDVSTFYTMPRGLTPMDQTIPIGRPIPNVTHYIVDKLQRLVPVGVPGELYIGGDGVGRGYLQRPDLTAEKFVPDPFSGRAGARLYRTGDLCRYLSDGNIDFLGRIDYQVKVRGFRIELGEIESALLSHAGVREAVVLAREDVPGDRRLVAYASTKAASGLETCALQDYLKQALPEYMVPTVFVIVESLPLTPNGKVDRKALPAPEASSRADSYIAPYTAIEEGLCEIWADVLGLEQVGIYDNFFELGGHSLLATQVFSRVRNTFQVDMPLRALFEAPTIANLAQRIETARGAEVTSAPPVVAVSRDGRLPLSFSQQRLWFLNQYEPESAVYNMPMALHLVGVLDFAALEESLTELVQRHESLRTTFAMVDDVAVQVIHSEWPAPLKQVDLTMLGSQERTVEALRLVQEEYQRLFDLERGPLFRSLLVRLDDDSSILVLTMHHIVSDGWSMGVLRRELAALYNAFRAGGPSPLHELPVQYADYAVWQREWLQGEALERQLSYWKKQLAGAPSLLELPTDRPRLPVRTFCGATKTMNLSAELTDGLKSLGRKEGTTLFMTLLAAFQTLLGRYSGQDDIVVGTPIANRTRAEAEGLIGLFLNTLVLRTDLAGVPSFVDLLGRVRETALGAYAHQDLPFENVVEQLTSERSLSHSPVFQVLFTLHNTPRSGLDLEGLRIEPMRTEGTTAKFDLSLSTQLNANGLRLWLEYNTDLFDGARIERMLSHYRTLLEAIVADPDQRVSRLPLLTDPERQKLLVEWNNSIYPFCDRRLHQLVEEQVNRSPDSPALWFEGISLSYAELDERSNRLAHALKAFNVGEGIYIGVALERSLDLVVALLGVLKAGAAYIPIDLDYPAARISSMLQQGNVGVIVSREAEAARLPEHFASLLLLDRDAGRIASQPAVRPNLVVDAESPAYVIYTSGSTGLPKGVVVPHRAILNHMEWMAREFPLTADDRVPFKTPVSFDASVWECWGPLMAGAQLIVARPGGHTDPAYLVELIRHHSITTVKLVPSLLQMLLEEEGFARCDTLRQVFCGAESLPRDLQERFFTAFGERVALHNLYGPTEAAIDATGFTCRPGWDRASVPIGRPISNVQAYVLDRHLNPAPLGVPGELYLGGANLATAYLNASDLTAEKFVPDPFGWQPGSRLYRTGDLVRTLADGNIEFLGRIDHQVKVRGFRIELGEIESVLLQHPGIREAVVLAREDVPGDTRLVAYVVSRGEAVSVSDLREHVLRQLPAYMLPSTFVQLPALPLSSSGKVDRKSLPTPEAEAQIRRAQVEARTPIEEGIAQIWREVLRLDWIGVTDSFFELGGHSLLATQVVSRIRSTFQVDVPLRALFEAPTVAGLAEHIDALRRAGAGLLVPSLTRAPREGDLPLSFSQQRLWFIDQLQPGSSLYNVPTALRMRGALDMGALHRALEEIFTRHEVLRTRYAVKSGNPIQVISEDTDFPVPIHDLSDLSEDERVMKMQRLCREEANRPFNLAQDPMMRAQVLRLGAQEHLLLLTLHHIASDGWSRGILMREMSGLYNAFSTGQPSPLSELPVQYADYAVWQRGWLQGEALQRQADYWRSRLSGAPPVLELPTDRSRETATSYEGAAHRFRAPSELSAGLHKLCREGRATPFMALLTAFKVLLYRWTGQLDLVVGTDVANRTEPQTEGLIGFFLNHLVLRTDLSGDPSFRELLGRVREACLGAYAHQDLPFDKLVEVLQPERRMSHTPVFQVLFVVQNVPRGAMEWSGLEVGGIGSELASSKFDLSLFVGESGEGFSGAWVYRTDLFEAGSIRRLSEQYLDVLGQVLRNPDMAIDDVELIAEPEPQQEAAQTALVRTVSPRGATRRAAMIVEDGDEG